MKADGPAAVVIACSFRCSALLAVRNARKDPVARAGQRAGSSAAAKRRSAVKNVAAQWCSAAMESLPPVARRRNVDCAVCHCSTSVPNRLAASFERLGRPVGSSVESWVGGIGGLLGSSITEDGVGGEVVDGAVVLEPDEPKVALAGGVIAPSPSLA